MKTLSRIVCLAVAAALMCASGAAFAQTSTNAAASTNAAPAAPKVRSKAITGLVDKVDNDAKTLTIQNNPKIFTINSKTRIIKDNDPATLADLMPGDRVTIHAKDDAAGNAVATSIRAHKPKATGGASTNAPANSK